MHYSHQTDRFTTTTRGRGPEQELIALFGSVSLHQLNSHLEEMLTISSTGARTLAYPPAAVMAIVVMSWATGSTGRALALLTNQRTWQACRHAYRNRSGIDLPTRPPSRNQVRYLSSCLTRLDPQGAEERRQRYQDWAIV